MIPFQARKKLGKLFVSLLILLLVAAIVLLCWTLWLNRFVVYTRNGVRLDFNSGEISGGVAAVPPTKGMDVDIYYNEGENIIQPENTELTQLMGFYASEQMLTENFAEVEAQIKALPAGTPVMLDVKNIRGSFHYSTALGATSTAIDPIAMDRLISYLRQNEYYIIARLPAFRDFEYGLNNVNYGIFNPNRLSLWMDEDRCYWLNPASEGTLDYLRQITTELKSLGFDEVLFQDFRFPDTEDIYVEGDRNTILAEAAKTLVTVCATDTFAVSFHGSDALFPLPEGRSRLFLENIAAADASNMALQTGLEDATIRLVFLTDLLDTRFDSYGVLRPVSTAEQIQPSE